MFIYVLLDKNNDTIKIGRSRSVSKRMRELQTANSTNLILLYKFETIHAIKIEKYLHNIFQAYRINGEWFEYHNGILEKIKLACTQMDKVYDEMVDNNHIYSCL